MLTIIVPGTEFFNEETEEFEYHDNTVLELEHSLISLSKWESEFEKPFLTNESKSTEEILGYIKAMVLNPKFSPEVFSRLTKQNLDEINRYIESNYSATTFGEMPHRRGRNEIITSELIYYWLVAFNIPFEVETWHLNRLFALVKICNLKNSKPTKMTRSQIAQRNRALNEERRAKYNTTG